MQGTGHVGTSATRRTLWALLWCSIVALLFPAALALGVVVHLDLALTRAATRQIVHAVLAGRFHGSLVVGPIVELTLSRVEIDGVLALAPDGTEVLAAERVVADGGLAVVLASLRSSRAERLHLPVVEIDAVRVDLARGDDGVLLLARAFEPVRPPPELPPPQPPAPSRFVLTLPALRVGEITVRGPLGGTELEARVRGLSASLRVAHEEVTLALDRTEVELDRPVPLRVTVQGHARLTPTGPDAWARLEGALADIRMAATASIAEGHRVALALDVPSITPDTLRRLVGEHPLRATAGAAARVEGSLREGLAVHARGRLDNGTQAQGSIRLTGRVDLAGPTPLAYARLDVSEVNLAAVHTLPATSLGATVWAWGVVDGAGSRLGLRLSTEPTTVAGQHLPGLAGEAQIDPEGAELALQAREPGASVLVSARYRRGQPAGYGLLLDLPALQSVPRLLELLTPAHPAAALAGGARLRSDGLVRPAPAAGTDDVDLGWEVSVDRARWPERRAQLWHARSAGRLRGARDALQIDAALHGRGLGLASTRLDPIDITARGPLAAPRITVELTDETNLAVNLKGILLAEARRLDGLQLALRRGGSHLEGTVARVAALDDGVILRGIALRGAGEGGRIDGSLRIAGRELTGRLEGKALDLDEISSLLDLRYRLGVGPLGLRGRADLDLDLSQGPAGRQGHVRLGLTDAAALIVSGVSLQAGVDLRAGRIRPFAELTLAPDPLPDGGAPPADPDACSGPIAHLALEGESRRLHGGLLDARSWRGAAGEVTVTASDLRLRCLARVASLAIAAAGVPLRDVGGKVNASMRATLLHGGQAVRLDELAIDTDGLLLDIGSVRDEDDPGLRIEGLDLGLRARFLAALPARAGQTAPHPGTELSLYALGPPLPSGAARPTLATVSATVGTDLGALLPSAARTRARLLALPLTASVRVPRIALRELGAALPAPAGAPLAAVRGEAELSLYLEGSLGQPEAAAHLQGFGLAHAPPGSDETGWAPPVDVDLVGSYSQRVKRAELTATVMHEGRPVATIDTATRGDLVALALSRFPEKGSPPPAVPALVSSVRAQLVNLPLGAVPALAEAKFSGRAVGSLSLTELGTANPRLSGRLQARRVRIGDDVTLQQARIDLVPTSADGRDLRLTGSVLVGGGGQLSVDATGSLSWQGYTPSADLSQPARLRVVADRFPVEVLGPAVATTVPRVGGRLDGVAAASYADGAAEVTGKMQLRDGMVYIPQLGQELRQITADLEADGRVLDVTGVEAHGETGRATGWLRLDYADLRRLALTGRLEIGAGEEMPASLEGVSLGSVRGRVDVSVVRRPDDTEVQVTATDLFLRLPASAGVGVQSLDDHPDVTFTRRDEQGQVRAAGNPYGPEPAEVEATTDGKQSVRVELKNTVIEGPGVRLVLQTAARAPIVAQGGEATGQIEIVAGHFNLLGKLFEIDRGVLTLQPAEAPYLNVTARWDSPEGTTVFMDYAGRLEVPIDQEAIQFRSVPGRSHKELIALLLFGDAGQADSGDNSGAAGDRSASLMQGAVATQLNTLFADAGLQGLSLQSGTTGSGYVRTKVSYQVTDEVSAGASYEAPSEQGGNTTQTVDSGARTQLNVDWRFHPNWLLRGTFGVDGNASSGVDLLFQYRYE